ncbi:MAG: ABC transporter substrate-binding protein [Acidimicrobiales bacterium]|nr:ABC transporter substrate-binding protein [Acidimicrobiales bacterium]
MNAISGDVAFLGIPNQRGVELAIADYGPVGGHDVDLGAGMDDLCSADGGQAAAQMIVADQDVVGVIGTSCSGAATAASPLVSEAGMVMISGSNTAPALTSDLAGTAGANYHAGYYRTAHNDLYQGAAAAGFALDVLGVGTAAAIHDGDPYTEGLARAFADAFAASGGTVTGFTAVNKGDTDMVPVLTEVATGSPELLFFPIFQPEGDFIVQQIAGVSGLEDTVLMGADGLLNSNFMALAETEGMYFSGPDVRYGANFNQATGQTADAFLDAYEANWGEAPAAPFWAHSYDATTLLLDAIAAASYDDDGTLVIDRAGVREFLDSVSDYSGIIGLMSCDEFGDCGSQKVTVIGHADSADVDASNANVVYEFAPGGSSLGEGHLVVPGLRPKAGGTLVMATNQVGQHVNHGVQSGVGIGWPSSKVFAALVSLNRDWEALPYLAESWDISDDQLTATFNLVAGATFHDGEPITSEDVAYSIAVTQANHPFTGMLAPIESVDTPDDTTVVLNLSNPHPALLVALSDVLLPIIPKHIFDDGTPIEEIKGHPRNKEDVVGSGPFVLTEYAPSEKIVLTRYDGFFIEGRPYLDEIILNITPDENTMMLGLENGEIDAAGFASVLNSQRVADNPDLVLDPTAMFGVGSTNGLQFNTAHPVISDLRVRQAIAYAIDRDHIINQLHQGQTDEQLAGLHPGSPFYNPDVERYDVDLDKARALLAEAGYADGLDLTINYIPGPDEQQRNVAEYIAQAVAEVDINMEVIQAADLPSWAGIFFGGPEAWHMTMNAYFNWGDPVIGVQRAYICDNIKPGVFVNNSSYCNERVDELLYAAAAEPDFEARKAMYDEFQAITAEELPFYYINALPIYGAYQADVMGMPDGPWGTLTSMHDTWLNR